MEFEYEITSLIFLCASVSKANIPEAATCCFTWKNFFNVFVFRSKAYRVAANILTAEFMHFMSENLHFAHRVNVKEIFLVGVLKWERKLGDMKRLWRSSLSVLYFNAMLHEFHFVAKTNCNNPACSFLLRWKKSLMHFLWEYDFIYGCLHFEIAWNVQQSAQKYTSENINYLLFIKMSEMFSSCHFCGAVSVIFISEYISNRIVSYNCNTKENLWGKCK